MRFSLFIPRLGAVLAAALWLAACGPSGTATSTPTSTLGTDSAATRVGGLPDSLQAATPAGR